MTLEELHCGELLKRINELMEKNANNDLQSQGVTVSQMKTLIYLEHQENHCATLKEIERYFGLTQATIAGIVVRLERKELVSAYSEPSDKRVKHVRLTEKGIGLCMCTKASLDSSEARLIESLDEAEQAEFYRLLRKVYDGFRFSQ